MLCLKSAPRLRPLLLATPRMDLSSAQLLFLLFLFFSGVRLLQVSDWSRPSPINCFLIGSGLF